MKYWYVLLVSIVFFLIKYFLVRVGHLDISDTSERSTSLIDLLDYLPFFLLIVYVHSSSSYRHVGLLISLCLILVNITFPLTIKFSTAVTSLGQQDLMISDGASIVSPFLFRYLLLILSFLVVACFFYLKKHYGIARMTLFCLLAVLVTNAVAIISAELVGHFKWHQTEKKNHQNRLNHVDEKKDDRRIQSYHPESVADYGRAAVPDIVRLQWLELSS